MGYYPASVETKLLKQIEMAAAAGKQFYATTGTYAMSAGNAWAGISIFFTARATKIVCVGARGYNSSATNGSMLRKTTSDPALAGHSISGIAIANALGSGGAATSGGNLTSSTEAINSSTGTLHRSNYLNANSGGGSSEMLLKPSDYIIIAPGIAGGFLLITNGVSTNNVFQELIWCEI